VGSHLLQDRGQITIATFEIQHQGSFSSMVALLIGPLARHHMDRELAGLRMRAEQVANTNRG
jgi:hypothetical protein